MQLNTFKFSLLSEVIEPKGTSHVEREKGGGGFLFPPIMFISRGEGERGGGLLFPPIMFISRGEGEGGGGSSISTNHVYLTWRGRKGGGGLLFPPIMFISRGEGEGGGGSSISTNHVYLTWRGRKGGLLFPPIMYISRGEGELGLTPLSTNHVYNFDIPEFTLWRGLVFNATFNNISVTLWRTVFFWWRKPGKKYCPVASHWQTLWHYEMILLTI